MMPRPTELARALPSLVLLVLLASGVHMYAVRAAANASPPVATRLDANAAAPLFERALPHYERAEQTTWVIDVLTERARALVGEHGPAASLDALAIARIGTTELPADRGRVPDGLLERLNAAGPTGARILPVNAAETFLERLREDGVVTRGPSEFVHAVDRASLWASLGWVVLLLTAAVRTSGRRNAPLWGALNAAMTLSFASVALLGTFEGPLTGPLGVAHIGLTHGIGAVLGAVAAGLQPLARRRMIRHAPLGDGRVALVLAAVCIVSLGLFGSTPDGSLSPVNLRIFGLGSVQPLAPATLFIVVGVAQVAGRFREALARPVRGAGLRGLRLLVPFGLAVVLSLASARGLRDYGSAGVTLTALALLSLVGTRGPAIPAGLLGGLGTAWVATLVVPLDPLGKVGTRVQMFRDAWTNMLEGADQSVRGLWSVVAGGFFGVGPGHAIGADLPAGHTDLALAWVAETTGVAGLSISLALLGVVAYGCTWVSARLDSERYEERLVPAAVAAWLVAQAAIIGAGTLLLAPLTGIVVPFLSVSGTAVATALVALGWVVGSSGRVDEVRTLNDPKLGERLVLTQALVALGFAILTSRGAWLAGWCADEITVRPVLTRQADDEVRAVYNPRIQRLFRYLPPRTLVDRNGEVIARSSAEGGREYPFGPALAPVTGVLWNGGAAHGTLEALVAEDRRLTPTLDSGFDAVRRRVVSDDTRVSTLALVRRADEGAATTEATLLAMNPGAFVEPFPFYDYSALLPAARSFGAERAAVLEALRASVPDAQSTLDAKLQAEVYDLMETWRQKIGAPAIAVVVRDPRSGEEIVHASAPAVDPAKWQPGSNDPAIIGPFGAQRDLAGTLDLPPGSTFKPVTLIAALEAGIPMWRRYGCRAIPGLGTGQGGYRVRAGNHSGSVVDAKRDPQHLDLSARRALIVSCNVYFAQLGLDVGPELLYEVARRLPLARVDKPVPGGIELADLAYGQWTTLATARQLSLLYAALANHGTSATCSLLRTGEACEPVRVTEPSIADTVVEALSGVVTEGTGTRAKPPSDADFVVSGKTGTAEQDATKGEDAIPGADTWRGRDHAWFGGMFEDAAGRRLAFTVLVVRGGAGATAAAPIVPAIGRLLASHGYLGEASAQR